MAATPPHSAAEKHWAVIVNGDEAAQELEIPLGTVLSRVHRARQFLRQRLDEVVAGRSNVISLKGRKP